MFKFQLTKENLEKECSLCYLCKTPLCQYLLTGEPFYGQEIGRNKETGGMRTYECPHYEFDEELVSYDTKEKPKKNLDAKIDYTEMYDELIDEYKKTSYIYKYILKL